VNDDVLRADARLRRTTLAILGIAVLAALSGMAWFQHWLAGIGELPGTDLLILRLRRMIALALTASAICLSLLAWYAAHKGTRAVKLRQWPLPGTRVLRDTPIRRGDAAERIGRWLQVGALVLLALAAATGIASWRMLLTA
jgi:hypothetical protein